MCQLPKRPQGSNFKITWDTNSLAHQIDIKTASTSLEMQKSSRSNQHQKMALIRLRISLLFESRFRTIRHPKWVPLWRSAPIIFRHFWRLSLKIGISEKMHFFKNLADIGDVPKRLNPSQYRMKLLKKTIFEKYNRLEKCPEKEESITISDKNFEKINF